MRISSATDIGRVRSENQDSFAAAELADGGALAVVCDGMGGHAGGKTASSVAAEVISREITENYRPNMNFFSLKNLIMSAINAANAGIIREAERNPELAGMGTTVVLALCGAGGAVVAHLGDSRCYLIENGSIKRLTKDHSLVQELIDGGYITDEQAVNHPNKNIITRALGIGAELSIDFSSVDLTENGTLLLCTDGLTNLADDETLKQIISQSEFSECADKLISLANENGGTDNITAVLIQGGQNG